MTVAEAVAVHQPNGSHHEQPVGRDDDRDAGNRDEPPRPDGQNRVCESANRVHGQMVRLFRGSIVKPFGPSLDTGGMMGHRYQLRLADGSDAGEVEYGYQPTVGDLIYVAGNKRARVTAFVPLELVEEFVRSPLYGILEIESVALP